MFGFVGSDVHQKLVQLECLRKGGASDNYVTIEHMILYEKENGVFESDKTGNGCRTLLRLHRALGERGSGRTAVPRYTAPFGDLMLSFWARGSPFFVSFSTMFFFCHGTGLSKM